MKGIQCRLRGVSGSKKRNIVIGDLSSDHNGFLSANYLSLLRLVEEI